MAAGDDSRHRDAKRPARCWNWKGRYVQIQGLPAGVQISSSGRRLGAALLDGVLAIVTLGIGWLIWDIVLLSKGQSPGKKLLGMRVISSNDMKTTGAGMLFVRDYLIKSIIAGVTLGIAYLWILFDPNKQALYDKVLNTIVVDDPQGLTLAGASSAPTV